MSTKGVEEVLCYVIGDAAFVESLFIDPDRALEGFDLTAEEAEQLKGMSRIEIKALAVEEW